MHQRDSAGEIQHLKCMSFALITENISSHQSKRKIVKPVRSDQEHGGALARG